MDNPHIYVFDLNRLLTPEEQALYIAELYKDAKDNRSILVTLGMAWDGPTGTEGLMSYLNDPVRHENYRLIREDIARNASGERWREVDS